MHEIKKYKSIYTVEKSSSKLVNLFLMSKAVAMSRVLSGYDFQRDSVYFLVILIF